jgi:hypothetical protein
MRMDCKRPFMNNSEERNGYGSKSEGKNILRLPLMVFCLIRKNMLEITLSIDHFKNLFTISNPSLHEELNELFSPVIIIIDEENSSLCHSLKINKFTKLSCNLFTKWVALEAFPLISSFLFFHSIHINGAKDLPASFF